MVPFLRTVLADFLSNPLRLRESRPRKIRQRDTQIMNEVSVTTLSGSRSSGLRVVSWNRESPRLMTRDELIQNRVEADNNRKEFARYLKKGLTDDYSSDAEFMSEMEFFEGYYGLSTKNTVDQVSIELSRGDFLLSISAHKLLRQWVGFDSDWDCNTAIILAKEVCVAVIATSWVGGDGTCNLFVDFRCDTPQIYELKALHNNSCVDAIATSDDGKILFRDWWKRLGILIESQNDIGPISDEVLLKNAEMVFNSIPRDAEMAEWVYPWPFQEDTWGALPQLSV